MTCTKRNCPQCASVEHTGPPVKSAPAPSTWETVGPTSYYEDDTPTRYGHPYTD